MISYDVTLSPSLLLVSAHALDAIFCVAQLDAITLRQRHPRLDAFPNDKNVVQPRAKGVTCTIFHVDNLEGTRMAFTVQDRADTANTVTCSDHCNVANLKLDVVEDLATRKVVTNRVIHLDIRIWVLDCSPIMGDTVWDALWPLLDCLDFAQLVRGFILANPVDAKLPLGSEEHAEGLFRFFDLNDIHEASWEEHVCPHLAINLDQALQDDHLSLIVGQGIF